MPYLLKYFLSLPHSHAICSDFFLGVYGEHWPPVLWQFSSQAMGTFHSSLLVPVLFWMCGESVHLCVRVCVCMWTPCLHTGTACQELPLFTWVLRTSAKSSKDPQTLLGLLKMTLSSPPRAIVNPHQSLKTFCWPVSLSTNYHYLYCFREQRPFPRNIETSCPQVQNFFRWGRK